MRREGQPPFVAAHIDEAKDQAFEPTPKPDATREGKNAELTEYEREAQGMLEDHKRLFMTYAGDVSLSFRLGKKFFIDLEHGEVNIDARWFEERGYSVEQIRWALLHELTHFIDLANDPEGMKQHFDDIFAQAKKTGAQMMKKWEEACGTTHPDFVAKMKEQRPVSEKRKHQTMNAMEQAAYQIHHTFYNIFDDIWDNNKVARKAPSYEQGEPGGAEVVRLYREKLFAQSDYRGLPRHLQFVYKLIREEMIKGESVTVDDAVEQALTHHLSFHGRQYTAKEVVEQFIKPRRGRDAKASDRYFVLKNTLEPLFAELLAQDLAEWQPQPPEPQQSEQGKKNQEGEEGDDEGEASGNPANPFDPDYQKFSKNSPDQIDDEEMQDWLDKDVDDKKKAAARKEQEAKEEKKTDKEKAKDAQDALDRTWCERYGIPLQKLKEYRKIETEVEPYLEELSQLWQQIVYGSGRELERETTGYYKTGTELDIPHLIHTYPGVVSEQPHIVAQTAESARAMRRTDFKERLVEKPELIRVRLIGDRSGSMDEQKTHVLQQCFVLLLSSLREFNTYLNFTRSQTKSKLRVDTEGWIFGDNAERIKHLSGDTLGEDEQVEIIKQFARLQESLGSTYDHEALESIQESLTDDDRAKIAKGKMMDITIEVTDGGSSNVTASRQAVDTLDALGEIVRAFQIGETDEQEQRDFETVWNADRPEPYGARVGKDIANLLPTLTSLLKKYLGGVRL